MTLGSAVTQTACYYCNYCYSSRNIIIISCSFCCNISTFIFYSLSPARSFFPFQSPLKTFIVFMSRRLQWCVSSLCIKSYFPLLIFPLHLYRLHGLSRNPLCSSSNNNIFVISLGIFFLLPSRPFPCKKNGRTVRKCCVVLYAFLLLSFICILFEWMNDCESNDCRGKPRTRTRKSWNGKRIKWRMYNQLLFLVSSHHIQRWYALQKKVSIPVLVLHTQKPFSFVAFISFFDEMVAVKHKVQTYIFTHFAFFRVYSSRLDGQSLLLLPLREFTRKVNMHP